MITPYTPTAEELEWYERTCARREFPEVSAPPGAAASTPDTAAAVAASHTQSTAAPAPHAHPGSAFASHAQARALPGQPPPPRPPLAPCVLTAEQLATLVIQPRPALLDRWLCQGDLGYIFAPRGVGKTWMAMALPGAISCRRSLGLWLAGDASSSSPAPTAPDSPPAPDHIPVLYVDGEMALNLTQYRAKGLDLSHVHHLHHEHLFNQQERSLNIGEAEDRQRITDLLLQQGYQVLILDNLSSLAAGIDENKGMDYEPLSHWLLDLRRRKITVIVVHHAGRNGLMRGHSKREDACSWIIELRDARQEADPGAKFVSHFAKPSRNTGDPLPDLLWHFTTDKVSGITDVHCELAQVTDYEQFIQHVVDGVTAQIDIAEMMGKHRGCISKWATRALSEGRISGSPRRPLPPAKCAKTRVHANDDDDDDSLADFRDDDDDAR
jgi:hypothetical protein